MKLVHIILPLLSALIFPIQKISSQELLAKVVVNSSKVGTTDKSVFENLQQTLEQFVNDRQWTSLQFQNNERIVCNFNITVDKYDKTNNTFECTAMIQANRPVYNSQYTTTLYNNKDANFNFEFAQFDQLNFNDETVDNQLTALIAYYAYLIIGLDLDSFSPMGGTDVLQLCYNLVNNAQNLNFSGWKAFDDSRNRFAIINDYMEEAMKPFRQLQYDYYRKGLDEMALSVDKGRAAVTSALEELKKVYDVAPMSVGLSMFKDAKLDELTNIYSKAGTTEKDKVYELLYPIYPTEGQRLKKIKEVSKTK